MIKESDVYYNNPLFYIFMVLVLASFTYEIYYYNKLAAILIAASLFFLIAFNTERHLKVFLLIIFIIALMNNVFYYNYIPKANEEIRVVSLKYNRGIGEIKGRKVNITIDSLEEIVGSKIYAKGNFTRNLNISKGIIAICLSLAAGAMIYIVSGELVPESNKLYSGRTTALGSIIGLIIRNYSNVICIIIHK